MISDAHSARAVWLAPLAVLPQSTNAVLSLHTSLCNRDQVLRFNAHDRYDFPNDSGHIH